MTEKSSKTAKVFNVSHRTHWQVSAGCPWEAVAAEGLWGTEQEVWKPGLLPVVPPAAATAQEPEDSLASPRALAMAPTAAPCFNSNYDDLHRERCLCGYF